MTGVGRKLALALKGGFQTGEHLVKCGCKFAEFVGAVQVQPPVQFMFAQVLSGSGDRLYRAHRLIGQPVPAAEGDQ